MPRLTVGHDEFRGHWIGAENSILTIVEFSDYECPNCRKAHKKTRLLAAECAGLQGSFWEMNDALFSIQDKVKSKDVDLGILAVQIGLDRSIFRHCMASDEVVEKIERDLKVAINAGLTMTPTFLIDKEKYVRRIPKGVLHRMLTNRTATHLTLYRGAETKKKKERKQGSTWFYSAK